MFSSVDPSLAAGKMRKNYFVAGCCKHDFTESQAAPYIHLEYSVKIATFGSLKRVTESNFKISKSFPKSKINEFEFFINEETKNCKKNHQRLDRKYQFNIKAFKKYLSRDTIRLISLSEKLEKKK
jgi:hypothetical protein